MNAPLASRREGRPKPASRSRSVSASGALLSTILALALTSGGAIAATTPANIAISATVQATCLNTATNLGFGIYTGIVATATATITITCTATTPYTVGLGYGTSSGATATTRKMTGPAAALLNYGMYSNATWTTNWGNTLGEGWAIGTGNGAGQTLTVYGQVPAGQYVAPGAYTDTILATVTY